MKYVILNLVNGKTLVKEFDFVGSMYEYNKAIDEKQKLFDEITNGQFIFELVEDMSEMLVVKLSKI